MTPFDFLFSLYGLALGLSFAVIATGAARAIKHSQAVAIGWLTPLLAVFVALDISTFWTAGWSSIRLAPYSYGMLVLCLAIALIYFIAASLVFPDRKDRVASLNEHFWANKRTILLLIIASNALAWAVSIIIAWPQDNRTAQIFGEAVNAVFFLLLTVPAALTRRRWLFGALIGFQVVFFLASAAALAYQPQWGAYDPDGDGVTQADLREASRRASALPAEPEAK